MKLGIIISTNEPETIWNAFRLGNISLRENHEVKVFLINKGVEIDNIDNKKYNIKEQIDSFILSKGQILACGTCLKSRNKEGTQTCPISNMKELLKLIEESEKIISF